MGCTVLSFKNHSFRALAMTDSQDVISVSFPIKPRYFVGKIKEKEGETNMYQHPSLDE